jgi:hypothetical protein
MEQTLEQRIRQRAYEIWDAVGRPEGASHLHWLAAEREVLAASSFGTSTARPKATASKTGHRAKPARPRARKTAA